MADDIDQNKTSPETEDGAAAAAVSTTAALALSVSAWWRHQMETFSALLAICAGNSPVTGKFPAQRPVTWNFDVFFLSAPE